MNLTIDDRLCSTALDVSSAIVASEYEYDKVEGWTYQGSQGHTFPASPDLLNAFSLATEQLRSDSFGEDILSEWQLQRGADTMETFVDAHLHGYLRSFTGNDLADLLAYYLSPQAIVDGAWLHTGTWTHNGLTAHSFAPPSFREHDGFLWVQNATGQGYAVAHDE